MKPPEKFTRIINKKKYDVKTAILIAHDAYWDGNNFERQGRNTFLYKTPRDNYFYIKLTRWQGERDNLIPVSRDEAIELFENDLSEHETSYEEAFPGVMVEDA